MATTATPAIAWRLSAPWRLAGRALILLACAAALRPALLFAACGDGTVDLGEGCDDGNDSPADGCDETCQPEAGYYCAGAPSACVTACGDGIVAGAETCDDGDAGNYDGCSGLCLVEYGYTCVAGPMGASVCTSRCGDGQVAADEACDDGGLLPGDGCSAECRVEPGGLVFTELHVATGAGPEQEFVEILNATAGEVNVAPLGLGFDGAPLTAIGLRCTGTAPVRVAVGQFLVIGFGSAGNDDGLLPDVRCDRQGAWTLADTGGIVLLRGGYTFADTLIDAVDYAGFGCHLALQGGGSQVARSLQLLPAALDGDLNDFEASWGLAPANELYGVRNAGSPRRAAACPEQRCDGVDDNCDGATDLAWDRDGDLHFDAADAGCLAAYGPAAAGSLLDCADSQPLAHYGRDESLTSANCADGVDNDCDGLTDTEPECVLREDCGDGRDDDGDGLVDCFDPDCQAPGEAFEGVGAACDGPDDDACALGTVQCVDAASAACNEPPDAPRHEGPPGDPSCIDELDNDCDGLFDLDDDACAECRGDDDCADADACTLTPCVVGVCETFQDPAFDADGDGVCNTVDPCFGDNASGDTDQDGVCESDDLCLGDDRTGDPDDDDLCSDRDPDRDGDGCLDHGDPAPDMPSRDNDGDGVAADCDLCQGNDRNTLCPTGADVDRDGVCNDQDSDKDGDGCLDASDAAPCWPAGDDDGDGLADDCDPCQGQNARGDLDGDGLCGDRDPDDDGDGFPDAVEEACGSLANDADDVPNDADGNGRCDLIDVDRDGDGCIDSLDPEPLIASADSDGDGIGDACDLCLGADGSGDRDGDGTCDDLDECLGEDASGDRDGDGVCADEDCDETRADVFWHPDGEPALCDQLDNDCDGQTDRGPGLDLDGDGFCGGTGGDCDDSDPLSVPGRPEVCDGHDNNCDGRIDDTDPLFVGAQPEVCDGVDNDCDGLTDERPDGAAGNERVDADQDGSAACADCNDADFSVHPGAAEVGPDGVDNDCDGLTDEALVPAGSVYFSEIMVNPSVLSDDRGEWFELVNANVFAVELGGCEVRDRGGEGFVIDRPLRVAARGRIVFANSAAAVPEAAGGRSRVDFGYRHEQFRLDNVRDGLLLRCGLDPRGLLDEVAYTPETAWPDMRGGFGEGRALQLSATVQNGNANDDPSAWCLASLPYNEGGDHGTPGGDNEDCCRDADQDGHTTCAGDCRDFDLTIFPEAPEACDGKDNDCDGLTDESPDNDGDGRNLCQGDCDDRAAGVHPGAVEACDGIDNDCDGATDESTDADQDGHTLCGGDCDDRDPEAYPDALERCDGKDNDCDGLTDESDDLDGDGLSVCNNDCDDDDSEVYPGAPERCDGKDNDCDGATDEGPDNDQDGYRVCDGDCADDDPTSRPGAAEVPCDGRDNDCDPTTLDAPDADDDGFDVCDPADPGDGDSRRADCEPLNPGVRPSAPGAPGTEVACDGIDNDCDPATPDVEDRDADGFDRCGPADPVNPDGAAADQNDEPATDPRYHGNRVHPGAREWCDGLDNDQNGQVDEGCTPLDGPHESAAGACQARVAGPAAAPGGWLPVALALSSLLGLCWRQSRRARGTSGLRPASGRSSDP